MTGRRHPQGDRRALHVLVVDDSAVVREVMASVLSQEPGMTVTTAADPLISTAIAVAMFVAAYRLINRSLSVLMEAVPEHLDLKEVEGALLGISGVEGVHGIRAWTLTSGVYAMNVHIGVREGSLGSFSSLLREIDELLRTKFQITYPTVQFDCVGCDTIKK